MSASSRRTSISMDDLRADPTSADFLDINKETSSSRTEAKYQDDVLHEDADVQVSSSLDPASPLLPRPYNASSTSSGASTSSKVRAALLFVISTLVYESFSIYLAQRTRWPNSVALAWSCNAIISLVIVGLSLICRTPWGKRTRVFVAIADNGIGEAFTADTWSGLCTNWLKAAPLGFVTFNCMVLYALQSRYLQPGLSQSILTYLPQVIMLMLPLLSLGSRLPSASVLALALASPALYAFSMLDIPAPGTGVLQALLLLLFDGALYALTTQSFHASAAHTPLSLIAGYSPLVFLVTSATALPAAIHVGGFRWAGLYIAKYGFVYAPLAFLQQISTLNALRVFTSPVALAVLQVPKGLILTLMYGGLIVPGSGRHSSKQFYVGSAFALLAALFCIREVREKLVALKIRNVIEFEGAKSESNPGSSRLSINMVRFLATLSFIPLLCWIIPQQTSAYLSGAVGYVPSLHAFSTPADKTVDIVIAYYADEPDNTRNLRETLLRYAWIEGRDPRFILYLKNPDLDANAVKEQTGVDEVIRLDNRGREGGTYLQHILLNYNASVEASASQSTSIHPAHRKGFAAHTLFFQQHISWDWIARERLWLFRENTGYLHFAPYIKMDCGKDMRGNGDFPRYAQLYGIFREDLCPPTLQLGAYAAQFVVSRQRILQNAYTKYRHLDDILEADGDSWIHKEGTFWHYHGDTGPTNPYLGHMLERSWPLIFDCDKQELSDTCGDDTHIADQCQCFD